MNKHRTDELQTMENFRRHYYKYSRILHIFHKRTIHVSLSINWKFSKFTQTRVTYLIDEKKIPYSRTKYNLLLSGANLRQKIAKYIFDDRCKVLVWKITT